MPKLEYPEMISLKEKILTLNHQACRQILLGMAEFLYCNRSLLTRIFTMMIEDGVKYSNNKEGG
jgi:hypothetical protein